MNKVLIHRLMDSYFDQFVLEVTWLLPRILTPHVVCFLIF